MQGIAWAHNLNEQIENQGKSILDEQDLTFKFEGEQKKVYLPHPLLILCLLNIA